MAASEDEGHRGEAGGVMLEGLREGRGQFRGAIVIQEAKKLGGERGGRFTALKGGLEEGLAFRDRGGQAARGG
jgi:hypothetical protein